MKTESEGIVIEVVGNTAKIKTNRHGDCKNCGACPGDQAMVVDALNPLGAKAGQRVTFEIKQTNMLKAAFIVYILPLISIFIGVISGTMIAEKIGLTTIALQIAGAVIAFSLSVLYINFFEKSTHSNEKMQPVVTSIISKS